VQTLPREQIETLQLARLQRLLQRIWERPIPFFRRKLEAAGMTPADVRSLDDLRGIPTTIKNELRASDAEHPPLGDYRGATLDECVRVGCSTGTSGKPTLILWTRHDQAVDLEGVCRGRWRWGLRPGSSLGHGHPFGMYGGGISFSKGIEALGLLDIPCAPPTNTPTSRAFAARQ
jgi:phenylacetate-CoA ligase